MVGDTLGQSVSRREEKSSDAISSFSNQGSSAPNLAEDRKILLASLTSRARRASRPALYGAGRLTMESTSSLIVSRCKRASGKADSECHVVLERLASPVKGAVEQLGHAEIALEAPHLHGFLDSDLGLGRDVSDRRLDNRLLS